MRVPLKLQVGSVVLVLATALGALWQAGASAVQRERRRSEVAVELAKADAALARAGAAGLALVPEWPETLDPDEWDSLDAWLAEEARGALSPFDTIQVEGGFYVRHGDRYLGRWSGSETRSRTARRNVSDPPSAEADLIDAQVREALQREEAVDRVVDGPTGTVALRAAPLWVNGRKVAATWALARLDDRKTLEAIVSGYRLAAGLAIGGIGLALLLTFGLARTVSRQNREKQRMQAELRRSERLAALGKLLAGVAHEVRNPLAGIRSTAQLWERGIGPDPESVAGVVAEVDRLDLIVSRLLQFSRAESDRREPGNLNEVVVEAARLAQAAAGDHGVRVELDLQPSLPPVTMSSPAVIQVLRNLTTNAIQAMPTGGTLRLATRLDPSGLRAEACVSDSGPGLSEEVLAHLFEPFYTTRPEGTGLGLAIAREIALGQGGDLRAEPPNGRPGAAFTLSLPLAAVSS
jgi:two-component system sensor histidine kinase HydH